MTFEPRGTNWLRMRRVKKLHKAIMVVYNSMNWGEELGSKEDQAKVKILDDRQWLENRVDIGWANSVGDNLAVDYETFKPEFKDLEVKYLKAPKIAVKNL